MKENVTHIILELLILMIENHHKNYPNNGSNNFPNMIPPRVLSPWLKETKAVSFWTQSTSKSMILCLNVDLISTTQNITVPKSFWKKRRNRGNLCRLVINRIWKTNATKVAIKKHAASQIFLVKNPAGKINTSPPRIDILTVITPSILIHEKPSPYKATNYTTNILKIQELQRKLLLQFVMIILWKLQK